MLGKMSQKDNSHQNRLDRRLMLCIEYRLKNIAGMLMRVGSSQYCRRCILMLMCMSGNQGYKLHNRYSMLGSFQEHTLCRHSEIGRRCNSSDIQHISQFGWMIWRNMWCIWDFSHRRRSCLDTADILNCFSTKHSLDYQYWLPTSHFEHRFSSQHSRHPGMHWMHTVSESDNA